MSLTVQVVSAAHLPEFAGTYRKLAANRYDNPFCQLKFNQETRLTMPKYNQPNPKWDQELKWMLQDVPKDTEEIEVAIIDLKQSGEQRVMCTGSIPIDKSNHHDRRDVTLEVVGGKEASSGKPTLTVTLDYTAPKPVNNALKEELDELKKQNIGLVESRKQSAAEIKTLKAKLAQQEDEGTKMKQQMKRKLEELEHSIDGIKEELDVPPAKRARNK